MRVLPFSPAGALALALTLTACGPKTEATPPVAAAPVAATPEAPKADDMSKMDMAAATAAMEIEDDASGNRLRDSLQTARLTMPLAGAERPGECDRFGQLGWRH